MNSQKILLSLGLYLATMGAAHSEATMDDVENSFKPYRTEVPTVEGVKPGMVITAANVDQAKEALDPELYQHIKDGWVEITVGETTSFLLHDKYIQATKDGLNQTSLGAKTGEINGFVAGRPFPEEPDANDPRAGEKLAWNYKYGYNWGDTASIHPFYWQYKSMNTGKTEREIKFNFHFLNWKHRVNHAPTPDVSPNPSKLFRSTYAEVLKPFDVKNTQLLIHKYEDDLKRDDAWLYLGFQRRVRRLAAGQITDAFLGADIMIEDFEGYNGRVADMKWTYKGTVTKLMPFYNHNDMKLDEHNKEADYQYIKYSGKGNCFPDITWQLRKTYILESEPLDKNHPISKRVHYVDAQTFTLPRTLIYDRGGKYWKSWFIGQAHPDHHLAQNKGSGVSIDDAFSMIDIQAKHCTTGQFKGIIDPELSPKTKFSVQNMRNSGR